MQKEEMKKRYIMGTLAAEFKHRATASREYLSAVGKVLVGKVLENASLHEKLRFAWRMHSIDFHEETKGSVFHHEAGHALVAHILGREISHMSVRPSIECAGYVQRKSRRPKTNKDMVELIAILKAGSEAENATFGNHLPQSMDRADSDAAKSLKLVTLYANLYANGDLQVCTQICADGEKLAHETIENNLPALNALAERLKVKTVISGSEVADIIDAARAQTSAKPASPSL